MKRTLALAFLGTVTLIVLDNLTRGAGLEPKQVLPAIVAFVLLAALAEVSAELAAALGMLFFVSVLLSRGSRVFRKVMG